jgi:hypothetical protein
MYYKRDHDSILVDRVSDTKGMGLVALQEGIMIKEYLIHSYLYYILNESIISDTEYDTMCRQLDANWNTHQSVWKKYVSRADLKAGTGFTLFVEPDEEGKSVPNYPQEIVEEAETRLADYRANMVMNYQTSADNAEDLYATLQSAEDWFLDGIEVDYKHFFKCVPAKRKMALAVIERIRKERKGRKETEAA